MPQHISKNSKKKYGLTPGYFPKMLREATETANIPVWQKDGSIRYVTQDDFNWLVTNKMAPSTNVSTSTNPES